MATTSWKSCSSFEGYYASTGWLKNRNCYCDPLWLYGYLPVSVGQTTGRTVEIDVPLLYSKSITSSYEAWLYVSGGSQGVYTSGSVSLNASDTWKRFTFYNVTAGSGAYYEVKIDFGYGTVQCYTSNGKWPEARVTYTAVTSCSAPTSVQGSSSRVIPDQSYTFSWSGASGGVSNSISDYYVAYQYGNGEWTYASTTSTSYTFTPSPNYRGSTLRFAVQTRGSAGSSYYSSWAYSQYYTINSLPPTPSVSASDSHYSYDYGGTITFTASVGSDAQNDNLTIYYSTDSNFSSQTTYTSSFDKTISGSAASLTYYFRAWDGYEYSPIISKTVQRNTPPTISGLGLSYTSLPGKLSNKVYVRSVSTSPSVSEDVNYSWYIYYNTSETEDGSTQVKLSSGAYNTFDLIEYKGKYIRLKLIVNDGYDSRSLKSGWFYVPTDLSRISSASITSGPNGNVIDPANTNSILYTGNTIYITWELPEVSNSQLSRYSQVELQKQNGNNWVSIKTYPETTSTTSKISYTETYSLPSDIENGAVYRIVVYTKETSPGNQIASYIYTGNTLQRAPKPILASDEVIFNVSPSTIRPTSGKTGELEAAQSGSNLIFTHGVEDSAPNLGAKWTLTALVNGKTITLMSKKRVSDTIEGITSQKVDNAKITHTFSNAKWKSLFSQPTWNNKYSATITLSLGNDLGDLSEAVATTTITVDYREPVQWTNANSRFTEKIKYADNLTGNALTSAGSTSNNSAFLVNAGETIQLTIPPITDLNNDTGKIVYIERGVIDQWSNDLNTIKNATSWSKVKALNPSSSTTFEYTIPDISEDIFYVFRAWIKGTNTLESKGEYVNENHQYAYSPTVIRACRSRKPEIGFAKVADENNDGVFTIIPQITLKGSTQYSTYKNWERADIISGYPTKNITVTAEICSDGLFNSSNTETYLSKIILNGYNGEYSNVNNTIFQTISKPGFKGQTLFIKLHISLNTGFGKVLTSTSPIYTFYAMVPTISHRSHQVGINTNKFNTREILALATPSADKTKLRFSGEEETNTVNLYLDLSNLTLSSNVGTNGELNSKIKFGTGTDAKITEFDLSKCTVTTSLTGKGGSGVELDNFTIDGGSW